MIEEGEMLDFLPSRGSPNTLRAFIDKFLRFRFWEEFIVGFAWSGLFFGVVPPLLRDALHFSDLRPDLLLGVLPLFWLGGRIF